MTKVKFDPYRELDVPRDATEGEIKAAGKRRAKQTHPDVPGGNGEAFRNVSRALAILKDPDKRRHFDETGDDDFNSGADTVLAQAYEVIGSLLQQVLDDPSEPPWHVDLVAALRDCLVRGIGKIKEQRAPLIRSEKRAAKLRTRFNRKKAEQAGQNIMSMMVDRIAADVTKKRAQLDSAIAIHQRAMKVLDDYEFAADKAAATDDRLFRIMGATIYGASTATSY